MAASNRNQRGWKSAPAAGDLAAMVKCEREYVFARHGEQRPASSRREEAARRGKVEHDRTELRMERFHNAPPPAPVRTPVRATTSTQDRDGRCFVASAVYGATAPETDQLRAFRDRTLRPRRTGRALISTYYALGPSLVRLLGRWPLLRAPLRHLLDAFRTSRWVQGGSDA